MLVVDDHEGTAESLAVLLEMMGHEVRTSRDGRAALELAADWCPHLALLDISLPGLDGYDLARALRECPQLQGIVLAAVTGWGQEEDKRRAFAAGFDHHLIKPVAGDVLEKLLAGLSARG